MAPIRRAEARDIARIAEILVFVKRMNYRAIFREDNFSFNVLQVVSVAQEIAENPGYLPDTWVCDDGIVKGMIRVSQGQICELYVDHFFQGEGIGGQLIDFAVQHLAARSLWVLEKNPRAIAFYKRHGFAPSGERRLNPGTSEYIMEMILEKE